MAGANPTSPKLSFANAAGVPLANGTLTVYLAGTTTPSPTWQDFAQTTLNTNPVVLDARGECTVVLDSLLRYKFLLKDSGGATIWTQDNILGSADLTSTIAKVAQLSSRLVWADDYGTNTVPGTTDMTSAINAAIAAVGSGGNVLFTNAAYKTTAFLNAENLRGITLRGSRGQYGFNGTRIIGSHTDKAILSLVGSLFCVIDDICLEGDTASRPKTGLLLGRSSAASAGNHTFTNLNVQGFYSVVGVYNIASEENTFINPYIVPNAAPLAGLYMCQADGQAGYTIGGLTSSSMEANTFIGGAIGNADNTVGSTGVYLDTGTATGYISFLNTFFTKNGGDSFIKIRIGAIDGQNTEFPISFLNCVGEIQASGPTSGMRVQNTGNFTLANLTAEVRFNGGTNCFLFDGTGTTTLSGARLSTPWTVAPTLNSTFQTVQGCTLNLLNEASITIGNAAGSNITHRVVPTITTNAGGNILRDITGAILSASPFTTAVVTKEVQPTFGASVTINAALGNSFFINCGSTIAFAITSPTNPTTGQRITIRVVNNAGVLGVITWGGSYKLSAWVNPAVSNSRSIDFIYNGSNWTEASRTPADVPN